jgi:hypothetical protein
LSACVIALVFKALISRQINRSNMSRYFIYTFMIVAVLFTASCRTKPPVAATAAGWISGTVTAIQPGKDGYTATIITADKKVYQATVSRVNLEQPEQYRSLKTGDNISVRGEVWQMDGEHITVRELK